MEWGLKSSYNDVICADDYFLIQWDSTTATLMEVREMCVGHKGDYVEK